MQTSSHPSPTRIPDRDLLRTFTRTREEAAFTEIVRRYLPMAMGAALRRLKSHALAEEAVQNAFIALARKADSVPGERLAGWLHRAAFLEACAVARSEKRFLQSSSAEPHVQTIQMSREPDYEPLDEALQSLPALDRELLLRRYASGENVREISAQTGRSEEACQKRLERALALLRRKLGADGATAGLVICLQQMAARPADAAAVKKIAASALTQAAPAAGLTSGSILANLAACLTAAALASAMAWPRQADSASPPGTENGSVPRSPVAAAARGTPVLTPRPPAISRTLTDVLDSIASGRIGPLVEFLPQATVADLQAILREDDMANLSERSMKRTTAQWLAIRHWATIEPGTAWQYATARDDESTGYQFRSVSAAVFALWVKADPDAAWLALAGASAWDRGGITNCLMTIDDTLAEKIVSKYPGLYWPTDHYRINYGKQRKASTARRAADAALRGDPPGLAGWELGSAFCDLVAQGAETLLAQAREIPDWAERSAVMRSLAQRFPDRMIPGDLPPGNIRQQVERARYAAKIAAENLPFPTEPDRQLIWLETRGEKLAYEDPLHLLECVSSAEVANLHLNAYGPGDDSSKPDWLEAALRNAAQVDPQRTLRLLPGVIRNVPDTYLPSLLEAVITSWATTDPAGAIRWTSQHQIDGLGNQLHSAVRELVRGGEDLLAMLPTATDQERHYVLTGLSACYREVLTGPDPGSVLAKVTPQEADQLLRNTLFASMGKQAWPEALRVAGHASRAEQLGYMLPNLATNWLNREPAAATAWFHALSGEEQQAILEKAGSHYEFSPEGRAAFDQLKP